MLQTVQNDCTFLLAHIETGVKSAERSRSGMGGKGGGVLKQDGGEPRE